MKTTFLGIGGLLALTVGCTVHVREGEPSHFGGDDEKVAHHSRDSHEKSKKKSSKSAKQSESKSNGKATAKSEATASAEIEFSKAPADAVKPASNPEPFKGLYTREDAKAQPKGQANAAMASKAAGKNSQTAKEDTKAAPEDKDTMLRHHSVGRKQPGAEEHEPFHPIGPSTEQLAHPIVAPGTASENAFGYATPVKGCFEGLVFPLSKGTKKLPNFSKLDPAGVVYACEWDIRNQSLLQGFPGTNDRSEWFAIRYTGSFSVTKKGVYEFRLSSDDGSKLYIDNDLIVKNDGIHEARDKTGQVKLTKGDHKLRLEYFQGPGKMINLQLYVTPPEGKEGLFSVR